MSLLNRLKGNIYNLIRDDDENSLSANIFDGVIIILIIVNVVTIIAETFTLPDAVYRVFNIIEVVSVIVFSAEYLLRAWTSDLIRPDEKPFKARIKYIFSFMAVIDLLAILPFFLPYVFPIDLRVLRALRITRLLRLFKVNRYTSALSTIGTVFKKKASQLIASVLIVSLLMIIAAVLMFNIENQAQPDVFSNAFSALWWAIATLTTVGYGDIYPVTILGKILSSVIAILGIGLVAVPTGIISSGFMECVEGSKEHECDKKFCPYCGKKID